MNEQDKIKIVYVVTLESEFSTDFEVCGTFSTRELAERYILAFGSLNDNESYLKIDEFTLNPYKEEIEQGKRPYMIKIDSSGKMLNVDYADLGFNNNCIKQRNKTITYYCFANNAEQAVKQAHKAIDDYKKNFPRCLNK